MTSEEWTAALRSIGDAYKVRKGVLGVFLGTLVLFVVCLVLLLIAACTRINVFQGAMRIVSTVLGGFLLVAWLYDCWMEPISERFSRVQAQCDALNAQYAARCICFSIAHHRFFMLWVQVQLLPPVEGHPADAAQAVPQQQANEYYPDQHADPAFQDNAAGPSEDYVY